MRARSPASSPGPLAPRRRHILSAGGITLIGSGLGGGLSGCAHRAGGGAGVFDVRAHGAKGDGTTDDTAAFQAAESAAEPLATASTSRPAKSGVSTSASVAARNAAMMRASRTGCRRQWVQVNPSTLRNAPPLKSRRKRVMLSLAPLPVPSLKSGL